MSMLQSKSDGLVTVPDSCVVQTPGSLAAAMVTALGYRRSDRWLEPCVGNGALLAALSGLGVTKSQIVGLDIDFRAQENDRFATVHRGKEFLRWSNETKQRFDKIVANPPYIALERLDAAISAAATSVSLSTDIKITKNCNAWYAFLCAAIRLLDKNGSLCFLLPAAWDYANYAAPLRSSIGKYFSSVDIFRTATPIFRAENVQEGAIVLIAKGRKTESDGSIVAERGKSRHEVHAIDDLISALSRGTVAQRQALRQVSSPAIKRALVREPLGNQITVGLGTVTGDSSYFLLNESRRRELRIPISALRPIVSKAKHLASPKIGEAQWNALRQDNERVWLFYPSPRSLQNRFVQAYLDFGLNGGCKVGNHKISIRKPWFSCANVKACDAFMSGMSTMMPTISISAMQSLTATNTLYAVNFIEPKLSQEKRLGIAMSMLQSDVRKQLRENGRPYAAGLLKHEPCDLLQIEVPAIGSVKASWSKYRLALKALRDGDETTSCRIADSCIEA